MKNDFWRREKQSIRRTNKVARVLADMCSMHYVARKYSILAQRTSSERVQHVTRDGIQAYRFFSIVIPE